MGGERFVFVRVSCIMYHHRVFFSAQHLRGFGRGYFLSFDVWGWDGQHLPCLDDRVFSEFLGYHELDGYYVCRETDKRYWTP